MTHTAVPYPTKTVKYHMVCSGHSVNILLLLLLVFPFFDKNPTQERAKYNQLSVRGKLEPKFKTF